MIRSLVLFVVAAVLGAASPLHAQRGDRDNKEDVPRTHLPPPGMCRIWLTNVPPAQQPAPTDCASAVRNRPENGRVIFNDQNRGSKLPPVKSLRAPGRDVKSDDSATEGKRKPLVPELKPPKPEGEAER